MRSQIQCNHPDDYKALRALYLATNGDEWSRSMGWLTAEEFVANSESPADLNMGDWFGIDCDVTGRVEAIHLFNNRLIGSIPPELGEAVNLTWLVLTDNQLNGTIPPELGKLIQLDNLNLDGNQLNGTIPPELGHLINLGDLKLDRNRLEGDIPADLSKLVNLRYLRLHENQFIGNIPPEIGNLRNLWSLNLSNNKLSGSIPPELGDIFNLSDIWLSGNQLSGEIPAELGNLPFLWSLNLSNNQLTGNIPLTLGKPSMLRMLRLHNNQLSGSIPAELGDLPEIEVLDLSFNQLSGCLPDNLLNLCSRLQSGDISDNPGLATGSWAAFCADEEGMCSTSIAEAGEGLSVSVFPNPASDKVRISSEGGFPPTRVVVMALGGKEIKEVYHTGEIEVSDLVPGVYILRIAYPDTIVNRKLVKN